MTSVITLAPIAAQLARSISLDALFRHGSVEDALRDHRATAPDLAEAELPNDIQPTQQLGSDAAKIQIGDVPRCAVKPRFEQN